MEFRQKLFDRLVPPDSSTRELDRPLRPKKSFNPIPHHVSFHPSKLSHICGRGERLPCLFYLLMKSVIRLLMKLLKKLLMKWTWQKLN